MSEYSSRRRAGTTVRPVLMALAASFLLGGALVGYGVYSYLERDSAVEPAASVSQPVLSTTPAETNSPEPTPSATSSRAVQKAAEAVERVAEQQGGLDQRIAAAEQRIARLDLQAQAAAGNAARAEGLLIAFSARRALERGNELGFLADQLRLRFGDAMPNAVQTVVAFGRNPITLDRLVARLDGLAPELAQTQSEASWSRLRSEIAQLFVVRRESTPSPQPERRLDRARLFLQSGRVEAAVAEVSSLPGAANAQNWVRDARRYAAAQNALDLIETAAVLEPRKLRDGTGRAIEQASPADPVPAISTSAAIEGSGAQ